MSSGAWLISFFESFAPTYDRSGPTDFKGPGLILLFPKRVNPVHRFLSQNDEFFNLGIFS